MSPTTTGFASTEQDAKERYEKWKNDDPYPQIPPALLNSADLLDYVSATGMIFPFDTDERRLKPASYLVNVGGPFRYWDGDGNLVSGDLKPGQSLTLPRNTIAFVTLEPMFRLPQYIALRFNLQIKYIHAGLLVGTGPLVDPGFTGCLYLPLHNLTDNDYDISIDDGLVWMEFTKVSPVARWSDWMNAPSARADPQPERLEPPPRSGTYREFPAAKKQRRTLVHYLTAAFPGSIRSSIPAEIEKSVASVSRLSRVGIAGIVVVVLTLVVMMVSVLQLVQSSHSLVDSVRPASTESVEELRAEVTRLQDEVSRLQRQLLRTPASNAEGTP